VTRSKHVKMVLLFLLETRVRIPASPLNMIKGECLFEG